MPWSYAGLLMTILTFTELDKNHEGGKKNRISSLGSHQLTIQYRIFKICIYIYILYIQSTYNCCWGCSQYTVEDKRGNEAFVLCSWIWFHQIAVLAEEALNMHLESVRALEVVGKQDRPSHNNKLKIQHGDNETLASCSAFMPQTIATLHSHCYHFSSNVHPSVQECAALWSTSFINRKVTPPSTPRKVLGLQSTSQKNRRYSPDLIQSV